MTAAVRTKQTAKPVYLVRGDDASLVGYAVHDLLVELADGRDLGEVVEEHGVPIGEELNVGQVLDALTTPPMLTDRRVVVVRDAGRFLASDATQIVDQLRDPVAGVTLVLVAGGGTIPSPLAKVAQDSGGVIDTAVGTGRARTQWLSEQLQDAPVKLDARAAGRLGDHLGGDVSRLRGMLEALASAYGEGAAIDEGRLVPFLGEAGAVAPWELTDAIAAGKADEALRAVNRLSEAGGFHPLAILAILHRQFQSMLRLDGSGATTGERAAEVIGARSVFPARKALEQSRQLGSARIGRAIILIAEADLDLRGRSAIPGDAVLEVLVGRLSRLGSSRSSAGRAGSSGSSARRRGR